MYESVTLRACLLSRDYVKSSGLLRTSGAGVYTGYNYQMADGSTQRACNLVAEAWLERERFYWANMAELQTTWIPENLCPREVVNELHSRPFR